jgi:membrane protease YdiL (CAAX protease family)
MLLAFVFGLDGLAQLLMGRVEDNAGVALGIGAVAGTAILFAYGLAIRYLERRRVAELRRQGAVAGFVVGVVVGGALLAAVIGVIALFGDYHVRGSGSVAGAVTVLGLMIPTAIAEELLFRAVLFRMVEQWVGTWWALGISALVFGLLHLVNPGATIFGALAIAIEAGVMLGAAYLLTRSVWLAIGIHLGWNVVQGGIFGATVSGTTSHQPSLIRGDFSGSDLLTGGGFGPEASVVSIAIGLVTAVILLLWAARRGQLRSAQK